MSCIHHTVHEQLKPCVDVERITARIALRSARPRDLSGLRDTLLILPQLHAVLAACDAPLIKDLADALQAERALVELLQSTIKPEPSSVLREGGVIADGFDAELDELRGIQTNCGDFLLALETRERARTGIDNAEGRIQPRAWFLHRSEPGAIRQRAGRLPPPPDAEERRALHHAGTEGLRGQGAVRQRARAGAREISVRTTARPTRAAHRSIAAHRRRDRRTRCARHLCRARRDAESQRAAILG